MLGQPIPDPTHALKVAGGFSFMSDTARPGSLHAAVIRSPLAHATVLSVDRDALLRRPGVVAVFTAADVPQRLYNPATLPPSSEVGASADKRLLTGEPRHCGDGFGVVVATSREVAARAARTACADLLPLPAVLSLADAASRGRVLCRIRAGAPAVTQLLAEADVVIERSMLLCPAQHLCLETHACAAEPGPEPGAVRVWTNTQSPRDLHLLICSVLDLGADRVQVTKISEGGGFGAKQEMYEEALAAWLALRLRKPVRFTWTRAEEFTAGRVRQETDLRLRAGFSRSGQLVATSLSVAVDAGAYASHTPYVLSCMAGHLPSVYRGPHDFAGVAYYTNRTSAGAYRGYGVAEAATIVEAVMDEAAGALGVNPLWLRAVNLAHGGPGSKARAVLDKLSSRSAGVSSGPVPASGSLRGTGHAVAVKSSVADPGEDRASAAVRIAVDGHVTVATGTCDSGTGSSTALLQIAASELGIDDLGVLSIVEGDPDLAPPDLGSTAQRSIFVGGPAVARAAWCAHRRLLDLAAARLGLASEDLQVRWPVIGSRYRSGPALPVSELIKGLGGGELIERATAAPAHPGVSAVAVRLELLMDWRTRRLTVPACTVVVDCGVVVNPRAARGQVTGAVLQGLGLALTDRAAAETTSILAHGAPRSTDVPALDIVFTESASRRPTGVGELVIAAVPAAVTAAFRSAAGFTPSQLPLRPDVVDALCTRQGVTW